MPSKLGFGNSRKKALKKVTMGSLMHFKNPVKMDHAMKMKDLSGDNKITQKDVLIGRGVIDPPAKMGHAMKKYGAHKMSHPMKGYKSDAQRKAVHASKADGGKGHPKNKK
jgi:hypothetical protein